MRMPGGWSACLLLPLKVPMVNIHRASSPVLWNPVVENVGRPRKKEACVLSSPIGTVPSRWIMLIAVRLCLALISEAMERRVRSARGG